MDLICDVGAVYKPETQRYDHHQRTFNSFWNKDYEAKGIKLSSAGLIYKHYGREILSNILREVWNTKYEEKVLERVFEKLYSWFFVEIDAIDNGIPIAKDIRYGINTDLNSRIGRFNKPWNAHSEISQEE